jgi:hypothetical protein
MAANGGRRNDHPMKTPFPGTGNAGSSVAAEGMQFLPEGFPRTSTVEDSIRGRKDRIGFPDKGMVNT